MRRVKLGSKVTREPLRKASEFLKFEGGIQFRRCLDCHQWLPETSNHYYRTKKYKVVNERTVTSPAFDPRCNNCRREMRKNSRQHKEELEQQERLPKTPPVLDTSAMLGQLMGDD